MYTLYTKKNTENDITDFILGRKVNGYTFREKQLRHFLLCLFCQLGSTIKG